MREALRRIGGLAEPPLEPILPAVEVFHYRNKLEYSFAQTPAGAALGFHKAGRWDEVLDIERCWLTTDLGNAVRLAVRDWARAERLDRLRPRRAQPATCGTSSCAKGATPARRSSSS